MRLDEAQAETWPPRRSPERRRPLRPCRLRVIYSGAGALGGGTQPILTGSLEALAGRLLPFLVVKLLPMAGALRSSTLSEACRQSA